MITLNILWHMHQPDYRHPVDGRRILPWVRLHAVKGYNDLLTVLSRRESLASTVNFSGILLEQLHGYTHNGDTDVFEELSLKASEELSQEERQFILTHFFSSNEQTMIRPHSRYRELKARRDNLVKIEGIEKAAEQFKDQDLTDLLVWFNLAWIGFTGVRRGDVIEMLSRGREFSLDHQREIIRIHREITAGVLSGYRRLAEATDNELSFTPYHHPILPLLIDLAGMGSPNPADQLPEYKYPADAAEHVRRGISWYEQCFGRSPCGAWPAEGSVSDEALGLLSSAGVSWACTDQQNLPDYVQGPYSHLTPYEWHSNGSGLHVFFRDTRLADNIGFEYAGWQSRMAGQHLAEMVVALGGRTLAPDPVVTIALDGENPWENYPDGGEGFLEALADSIEEQPQLCCRTPRQIIAGEDYPRIESVSAGSWIGGNFDIWSRHAETRAAWRLLARARQDLMDVASGKVLNHLLAAEGSDWFWWFGDDFTTGQALQFDELFRSHLIQAYQEAGRSVPNELFAPVISERDRQSAGEIDCLIEPILDGRVTGFFEWRGAVRLDATFGQGSMARRGNGGINELWYGFSEERLFIRLEIARDWLDLLGNFAANLVLDISQDDESTCLEWRDGAQPEAELAEMAVDQLVECSVSIAAAGLKRRHLAFIRASISTSDGRKVSFPEHGRVPVLVISADFAMEHWSV